MRQVILMKHISEQTKIDILSGMHILCSSQGVKKAQVKQNNNEI